MRSFAYKNENFENDSYVPELIEGNPCYQASAYDPVMYDKTSDGDLTTIPLKLYSRPLTTESIFCSICA
jgi:hypothetical protein